MSDYLPPNLLIEILCRLPVESLLRFRCVSKQWCLLISSSYFISTHLSHSTSATSTTRLLLRHLSTRPKYQEKYSVYDVGPSKSENLTLVKELKFRFNALSGNHFRVVGFCNGILCLSDDLFGYTYPIILWNPVIRKSITLPRSRHVNFVPYGRYIFCVGFGFDQKNYDLKVVRIAYMEDDKGAYTVTPPEVEIYSLSTGLWKTVNSKDIQCVVIEYFYTSVYLNGAIHWVSYIKNEGGVFSNSLLVFDLTGEKFSEMSLPQRLAHVSPLDLSVSLCRGRISMIWYENGRSRSESCDCCAVWAMNQYGEMESWTQKFVVVLEGGISHAIGFVRNEEFLVENRVGDLLSYDPERKEFKNLSIHGGKDSFFLSEYAESLVLLDGRRGATTDPEEATSVHPRMQYAHIEEELFMEWSWSILYEKNSLCD